MPTILIVANQTLGGTALRRVVQDRIARGDAHFRVLVPLTVPLEESEVWMAVDPVFGIPALPPTTAGDLEEGQRRSQYRCDQIISHLVEAGATAEGYVGDRDPYGATKEALEAGDIDEVIVSTLPIGLSRWLKMDLPSRIARATDVPVTTVEAEDPDGIDEA